VFGGVAKHLFFVSYKSYFFFHLHYLPLPTYRKTVKKKTKNISNPHDKAFKFFFSNKEVVGHYLERTFPAHIIENIRFETLEQDLNSYVDEALKEHYSDVVYEVMFEENQPVKIALLFEHKSYVPDFPHLQLLRYMVNIWEYQLKKRLPLQAVLPIVVYHGEETWLVKPFESYFANGNIPEALQAYTPCFEYWLTDLHDSPAETIKQKYTLLSLRMAFLLMKHIFDKDLDTHLPEVLAGWEELTKNEQGKKYFQVILLYLQQAPKITKEKMKQMMEELFTDADVVPGSFIWDWMQKGKAEGEQLGLQKGEQLGLQKGEQLGEFRKTVKGIQKALSQKVLSLEQIVDLFEVSLDFVLKVQKGEIQ
jgi:predicted transposase/invertase (TIGR01784 family)